MRGKVPFGRYYKSGYRITPAHAGKRSPENFRVYGRTGSPPHMRGKVLHALQVVAAPGITPAHAGKRNISILHRLGHGDHPRTCGEKQVRSLALGRK